MNKTRVWFGLISTALLFLLFVFCVVVGVFYLRDGDQRGECILGITAIAAGMSLLCAFEFTSTALGPYPPGVVPTGPDWDDEEEEDDDEEEEAGFLCF